MRKLMILSLILLAAYSCKKKDIGRTTVSGYVADNSNNKTVPYAEVWLLREKPSFGMTGSDQLQYQMTDSSGKFFFAFDAEEDFSYTIASRAKYYYDNHGVDILPGQKNEPVVIKMQPKGWIKFNVINEPPLDTLYGLFLPGNFLIYFLDKDTSIFVEELGGETNNFVWGYKKSLREEWDKYHGKVLIPPLDTVTYLINY